MNSTVWNEAANVVTVIGLPFVVVGLAFQLADVFPRRWARSRRVFKRNRKFLNQNLVKLMDSSSALLRTNRSNPQLTMPWSDIPLYSLSQWIPKCPVPIDRVRCTWEKCRGLLEDSPIRPGRRFWPKDHQGMRYPSYHSAIAALDRPGLFDDLPSYRILEIEISDDFYDICLDTRDIGYFSAIDTCEALAFEYAAKVRLRRGSSGFAAPRRSSLRYRNRLGNPLRFSNRYVIPGISTLTIRQEKGQTPTFFLQHRARRAVAVAPGYFNVVPAAEFQPSVDDGISFTPDASVWFNIMREFAEEILGKPEAQGQSGKHVLVDQEEPYTSLEHGRHTGSVRPYFAGFFLDPLSWKIHILTIVVLQAGVFDAIIAHRTAASPEGPLVVGTGGGLPLNQPTVDDFIRRGRILPGSMALLRLALEHRDAILQ